MSKDSHKKDDKKIDLQAKINAAKANDDKKNKKAAEKNDELSNLKQELEKMTDMAKRAMADLQNVKRRQEEERMHIIIRANVNLLKALLPVLDNLNRSLEHTPKDTPPQVTEWITGNEIAIKQFKTTLTEAGLQEIEALNQPFNPDLHEALLQGPGKKDTVIEVLEKGYILGDHVLRHSKVKVGNGEKA